MSRHEREGADAPHPGLAALPIVILFALCLLSIGARALLLLG